jgi:hypothetical protein
MLRVVDTLRGSDDVGAIAVELLDVLFRDVTGSQPTAVRAFRDGDALLLLLRFRADRPRDPPVDAALMALGQLVGDAVRIRTGRVLEAGAVSLSAARGLAVFAFDTCPRPGADPVRLRRTA